MTDPGGLRFAKRITDPVHGTIALTPVEVEVISTRAFQRLRSIKQLGLAHYVYPGADYSRFAHSVGACHVAGKMLSSLREQGGADVSPRTHQQVRLAALLHDIGHYPFSHAMEEATKNYYAERLVSSTGAAIGGGAPIEKDYLSHEELGKEIVVQDPQIPSALGRHDFAPRDIYSVFRREDGSPYGNLVSSDLDADRIDYLLRTARHTGLPYGSVDVDYLVGQLVERENQICIRRRALRTADHFLLSRYFDYQQVAYHKTVVGFEWLLKDVLAALIDAGRLGCSRSDILDKIRDGMWGEFGDPEVFAAMRQWSVESPDAVSQLKAKAVVNRCPPKLLVSVEQLAGREAQTAFDLGRDTLEGKIAELAETYGIPTGLWKVWSHRMSLTKIGTSLPLNQRVDDRDKDEDRLAQAVWVLSQDERSVKPIMIHPRSLMSVLADKEWWALRLYLMPPPEKVERLDEIRTAIEDKLPSSLKELCD